LLLLFRVFVFIDELDLIFKEVCLRRTIVLSVVECSTSIDIVVALFIFNKNNKSNGKYCSIFLQYAFLLSVWSQLLCFISPALPCPSLSSIH